VKQSFIYLSAVILALSGCAPAGAPPESAAATADAAACTAQGDATYRALSVDQLARTSQNGLLFAPTPNHVFDAEQMGAEHERDSQITKCEQNGNPGTATTINGVPVVPPRIISN
jgi:hypothetical protein